MEGTRSKKSRESEKEVLQPATGESMQKKLPTKSDSHVQRSVATRKKIDRDSTRDRDDLDSQSFGNKSVLSSMEDDIEGIDSRHDELTPAIGRRQWLNEFRGRLELIETSSSDDEETCILYHCFAMTYAKLGNYATADHYYRKAVPYEKLGNYPTADYYYHMSLPPYDFDFMDTDVFCTALKDNFRKHHIGPLLNFVEFAIRTRQNLDVAERILAILPWIGDFVHGVSLSESRKRRIMLLAIQASNARHDFEDTFKNICKYNIMFGTSVHDPNTCLVALEKAKRYATIESWTSRFHARDAFVYSLTLSTVNGGIWHENTLEGLYQFGVALMHWGDQDAACKIFEECCLGTWYRFGQNHPIFNKALLELEKRSASTNFMRKLARFVALEDVERRSFAYEHIYVNTIIDLLCHVPDIRFDNIRYSMIQAYGPEHKLDKGTLLIRILAGCMEKLGNFQGALHMINTNPGVPALWKDTLLKLDEIRIISQDSGLDAASDKARLLLHQIGTRPHGPSHQELLMAVQRKLVALGVTHFVFPTTSEASEMVVEQDTEILGTGTFAIVHSVKVGHELYARKSIVLPRFRQHQVRTDIQNELAVTRKLIHPHTIRVFFTYEEKARFCLVMEPLADCDLEAFLVQHSSTPPTWSQRNMILKWLCCLPNTLAFIHSQGIRHKDIKPRNILVKGEDVIFADFGSSHAFLEEGGSTTEGPSHGYTKRYCAPEVKNQGKRNRAADIFSLGCVFTELAVWIAGHEGFDISKWHEFRMTDIDDTTTNAYHASLDRVKRWFSTCSNACTQTIYNVVIRRMMFMIPGERLTAARVSRRITEIAKHHNWEVSPCSKCRLGLWLVAADTTPQSPVVASTEDTLEHDIEFTQALDIDSKQQIMAGGEGMALSEFSYLMLDPVSES